MRVAAPSAAEAVPNELLDIAIALNSTAELSGDEVIGNPTEGALLLWLHDRGIDYNAIRARYEVVDREPFSTERKYMSTTIVTEGQRRRFVKGAPEIVMAMCDMTAEERKAVEQELLTYQRKAMRSEEHTSELQSRQYLVCRLLLEKKNKDRNFDTSHGIPLVHNRAE